MFVKSSLVAHDPDENKQTKSVVLFYLAQTIQSLRGWKVEWSNSGTWSLPRDLWPSSYKDQPGTLLFCGQTALPGKAFVVVSTLSKTGGTGKFGVNELREWATVALPGDAKSLHVMLVQRSVLKRVSVDEVMSVPGRSWELVLEATYACQPVIHQLAPLTLKVLTEEDQKLVKQQYHLEPKTGNRRFEKDAYYSRFGFAPQTVVHTTQASNTSGVVDSFSVIAPQSSYPVVKDKDKSKSKEAAGSTSAEQQEGEP